MFDQMVRTKSGGAMQECLEAVKSTHNAEFAAIIKERVGVALEYHTLNIPLHQKITLDKINNKILTLWLKFVRTLIPKSLRDEVFIATSIGERHKWLYDSVSLTALLESIGFRNIQVLDFCTSNIPDFNTYKLDINTDGSPYKGGTSLYMECQK